MAPIRKEDIRIVRAEPMTQPLSSYGQRVEPKPPSHTSHDAISVDSNGAYDVTKDPIMDQAQAYIDKQINRKVSHAMDKLASNMDRALEGATGDTGELQTKIHGVEGKVSFLTKIVGAVVVTGVVAGAWGLWKALKPKSKKKLEINQQTGLETKFIQ